ncbi:hypothetical protein BH11PSE14_BH11PSE14_15500 [soil metagenome]
MTCNQDNRWFPAPRAAMLISLLLLGTSAVAAQDVDNCATLLGSLSRELHIARALAPGQRSTFTCPREREARAAVGASRQRVLNALGTPDRNHHAVDGATVWSYAFRSRLDRDGDGDHDHDRVHGDPELSFRFNALDQVAAVECHLAR